MNDLKLNSYYFSFEPTKSHLINTVLAAVIKAGRYLPVIEREGTASMIEVIQKAANEASERINRDRQIAMQTAVLWAAELCRQNVMATPYGRLRTTGETYNGYVAIPDDVPEANHQGRGYCAFLREKAREIGPDIAIPISDKGQEKFDNLLAYIRSKHSELAMNHQMSNAVDGILEYAELIK